MELWAEISKAVGLGYEMRDAESARALVDALAGKQGDVAFLARYMRTNPHLA